MRVVGTTLAGFAVTSLLVTVPAFASTEVEEELAEMREVVERLEQKVDAQEEQLEHQGALLQDAHKVVREQQREDSALSGVGEFWQAVDVNMSVAASYAYNFHNPSNTLAGSGAGQNAGASGLFYPFHPDHNSFQVDQVWFDIGKAATEESRAGFQASILFGTTATFLGQGASTGGRANFDSTSDLYVHQAYVSYLVPLAEVKVDLGKFATILGAEVADASKNWNVTRGNLYNLLQPIDHLGVLGTKTMGPFTVAAGVVNEINLGISSPDINSEKSYLGKVGYGTDVFGVAGTVAYGKDGIVGGNFNGRGSGILDLLATFNGDGFSAWANFDYVWIDGRRTPRAWGAAIAGQVPLTEVLYAALRLEYVRDEDNGLPGGAAADFFGILSPARHSEVYGATGTLAYELAENLTLKGEVRYDRVVENTGAGPNEFFTNTAQGDQDQVVGIAQAVYAF